MKVETIRFDDLSATPVTRGSDFRITLRKVQVYAPASAVAPATETNSAAKGSCDIWMESTGGFGTHVEYTDGLFRVVDVNVKNSSNKTILRVDASMQYLDRAGTVLLEESAMLSSIPEPGDSRFALVRAKTMQPAHATAFRVPDATESVTFVLKRVRFADGTDWAPPAGQ